MAILLTKELKTTYHTTLTSKPKKEQQNWYDVLA
jgi:hypothetical protein